MNKKAVAGGVIAVVLVVLVCIPLIRIEERREYYNKWGKLAVLAETDPRAQYIIDNFNIYPDIMVDYFHEALSVNENNALDFLYSYPQHMNDNLTMSYTDEELNSENVPALYMSDNRWRYEKIGGYYIEQAGCMTVSLTMAYLYLTGKDDVNPRKIADIALEVNALGAFGGVDMNGVADICGKLGLNAVVYDCSDGVSSTKISHLDIAAMKEIINNDHVLLVGTMGETFGGHAIVITRIEDDGTMYLNDPASPEKTQKAWNFEELENEFVFAYDISYDKGGNYEK